MYLNNLPKYQITFSFNACFQTSVKYFIALNLWSCDHMIIIMIKVQNSQFWNILHHHTLHESPLNFLCCFFAVLKLLLQNFASTTSFLVTLLFFYILQLINQRINKRWTLANDEFLSIHRDYAIWQPFLLLFHTF